MKVYTWVRASTDLAERQSNCQWFRSWRDAGFDPFILTPESCDRPLDLTRVLKASQQPEHVWARWNVRLYLSGLGFEDTLLVAPTILPAILAKEIPSQPTNASPFIRYDAGGRVIYTRKSPLRTMHELMRHDFEEFAGQPFTDWDLLLLDWPKAPTINKTFDYATARMPWFVNYTQEEILELRAKRLAL